MFILGIIGILQILFLPGLILLKIIKFKTHPITHIIGIISGSLVINYCLVIVLTVFHLYLRFTLIMIMACEVAWIIWYFREDLDKSIEFFIEKFWKTTLFKINRLMDYLKIKKESSSLQLIIKIIYVGLCLIAAYISMTWIWKLFTWNLGSVFNSYDTIVSWNKWAIQWANNLLPINTAHYPQLLPINWSIVYLLMGDSSIQFFAKAIMPLFTLAIIIMSVDLGFAKKNVGYFIGSALIYLTIKKFLGSFVVEGLADLPSAFLAFSAFYFLLISQLDEQTILQKMKYSVLIALSSAGCAVTKQAGLLFLLFFSPVYFLFFARPALKIHSRQAKKIILITFLLVIIIVVPWYLYKQIMISKGFEASEISTIISDTSHAFDDVNIINRFIEISKLLGKYFYLLILLIPLSFFVEPIFAAINFLMIIPFFIIWSSFVSYDFRNLAIALPYFGISSGISLNFLFESLFKIIRKISFEKIKVKYCLIVLIILIIIGGLFVIPDDLLRTKQLENVMKSFSPSINQKLIAALEGEKNDFAIMTAYPIDNLPGMSGKRIGVGFTNYEDYRFAFEHVKKNKDLFLLVPKYSDPKIMDEIYKKIGTGEYSLLFEDDSWVYYIFIKVLIR